MKPFIRRLNDMKIRNKLIFFYVIVVMIPVLIVGLIVIQYFRQDAIAKGIEQTENNVQRVKTQTENLLKVPIGVSNQLLLDRDMERVATTRYDPDDLAELVNAYRGYTDFNDYERAYNEIRRIQLYVDNDTLQDNLQFMRVTPEIGKASWYKQAIESRSVAINWAYIQVNVPNASPPKQLSLVRRLQFPTGRVAVLTIEVDTSYLNSMLSQELFNTMIADKDGYIVAAKDRSTIGHTLREMGFETNAGGADSERTFERPIDGEAYQISVNTLIPESSDTGLTIVSAFSAASIVHDANRIGLIGAGLILFILLVALFAVYLISRLISSRLLKLNRNLNRVAQGDLDTVSRIGGQDEIGQLSDQFNYMVTNIKELMNQVYEASEANNRLEVMQREIKLKMLASQINPHFLFNALESIRMRAHIQGDKEIAHIVRLLGKLIRRNLEIGNRHTPLKSELDMVRSYLEIQKFRHGERLHYELLADPDTLDVTLPPLIVQPLIENAIVHGLENKEEEGTVLLRAVRTGEEVLIDVVDNGAGMTPERLRQVEESIREKEEGEDSRIGLRNVHQRLVMTYGEEYGLHISSEFGKGTQIYFKIPAGRDEYV
ncbi:sensor histidine kinase [Saccharibacillus sp. CPCC 101409]|uniref:cache domain-containing sensor histidine kinase n=1 Tax=Saccharibacillus sp. CPCC 101409 TaxID=3058041 RepID=UPI002670E427|nr:sensor histidine kinase [Saccharibacillus sp. CPCC 101409]MDO3413335.1 sensor histidine kinase [Saccharibacillus sp. CPCC 101409]